MLGAQRLAGGRWCAAGARLLDGADLDLAVARGAAYYGHVRRGRGVRIRGGTAQAYYVGVESSMPAIPGFEPPLQALCLAPFGMEEGTGAAARAGVRPGGGRAGALPLLRLDRAAPGPGRHPARFLGPEELQELQEIEASLPAEGRHPGEVVAVRLHARVTEAGTLELEALPTGGTERWKVELDVRAETLSAERSGSDLSALRGRHRPGHQPSSLLAWGRSARLRSGTAAVRHCAGGRSRPGGGIAVAAFAALPPGSRRAGRIRAGPAMAAADAGRWFAVADCSVRAPRARALAARRRAGWSRAPRAGSRIPESIAMRPSCPGAHRRMWRGSRR